MADLTKSKLSCLTCRTIAPSNPAMPPHATSAPTYPFQSIVCNFFSMAGKTFAAIADRYSNWLSILQLPKDNSQELINTMRSYFSFLASVKFFHQMEQVFSPLRCSEISVPGGEFNRESLLPTMPIAISVQRSPSSQQSVSSMTAWALVAPWTLTPLAVPCWPTGTPLSRSQASALHRSYLAAGSETSTPAPLANTSPGLSGDWLLMTER